MSAQIVIRVPTEMRDELRRLAERDERTVAQTARLAIRRYLESDESHRCDSSGDHAESPSPASDTRLRYPRTRRTGEGHTAP